LGFEKLKAEGLVSGSYDAYFGRLTLNCHSNFTDLARKVYGDRVETKHFEKYYPDLLLHLDGRIVIVEYENRNRPEKCLNHLKNGLHYAYGDGRVEGILVLVPSEKRVKKYEDYITGLWDTELSCEWGRIGVSTVERFLVDGFRSIEDYYETVVWSRQYPTQVLGLDLEVKRLKGGNIQYTLHCSYKPTGSDVEQLFDEVYYARFLFRREGRLAPSPWEADDVVGSIYCLHRHLGEGRIHHVQKPCDVQREHPHVSWLFNYVLRNWGRKDQEELEAIILRSLKKYYPSTFEIEFHEEYTNRIVPIYLVPIAFPAPERVVLCGSCGGASCSHVKRVARWIH
jgi:hypothetical protein